VSGIGSRAWRSSVRSPLATPEEVAAEPAPFPSTSADAAVETLFPDWRRRLTRNLSRRSDSRWEPLTSVHAAADRAVEAVELLRNELVPKKLIVSPELEK
jgi:hypothetical protein